jgi:glycerol-3-phosphate acyltransferase PlsX
MRIAVDVMSGDHGCTVVIEGVKQALEADKSIAALYLVGNEAEINNACKAAQLRDKRVQIVHASEVLTMDEDPLKVRRKKDSSIMRAIELVSDAKADAIISPGNTGALVAGSMKLGRLEGVKRPAIAARMPSRTQDFVLLDAGANDVCEPLHLAQFAVMGNVYAKAFLGVAKPRVGVLSNGSEETKGTDLTRGAAKLCRELDLNFIGYVEGFDLFNDAVDVVVTDGFTGNVVLKTAESLGYAIGSILKAELTATPMRKLGAALAKGGLMKMKKRMDPEVYGGAVVLGLNGTVIKTHGSSRQRSIANAIRVATEELSHGVNKLVSQQIARANERLAANETSILPTVPA